MNAQERIQKMEDALVKAGKINQVVHIIATCAGWTGYVAGNRIGQGYVGSLTEALDAAEAIVEQLDSDKLAATLGIEVDA